MADLEDIVFRLDNAQQHARSVWRYVADTEMLVDAARTASQFTAQQYAERADLLSGTAAGAAMNATDGAALGIELLHSIEDDWELAPLAERYRPEPPPAHIRDYVRSEFVQIAQHARDGVRRQKELAVEAAALASRDGPL